MSNEAVARYNAAVDLLNLGKHRAAVQRFRAVARGRDFAPEAQLELAKAELHGLGTRRDVPAAMKKLEAVARARGVCQFDNESAMLLLAQLYLHGWLVRRDYRKAVSWLRRAARLGSAAAWGLLLDLGVLPAPVRATRAATSRRQVRATPSTGSAGR